MLPLAQSNTELWDNPAVTVSQQGTVSVNVALWPELWKSMVIYTGNGSIWKDLFATIQAIEKEFACTAAWGSDDRSLTLEFESSAALVLAMLKVTPVD